jgi:hypothetical protein
MLCRMDHHHQLTDYQQDTGQQGECLFTQGH